MIIELSYLKIVSQIIYLLVFLLLWYSDMYAFSDGH